MMVETNPVAHSRRDKTRSEFKRSLQQNLLLKTSDLKYCKTLTKHTMPIVKISKCFLSIIDFKFTFLQSNLDQIRV